MLINYKAWWQQLIRHGDQTWANLRHGRDVTVFFLYWKISCAWYRCSAEWGEGAVLLRTLIHCKIPLVSCAHAVRLAAYVVDWNGTTTTPHNVPCCFQGNPPPHPHPPVHFGPAKVVDNQSSSVDAIRSRVISFVILASLFDSYEQLLYIPMWPVRHRHHWFPLSLHAILLTISVPYWPVFSCYIDTTGCFKDNVHDKKEKES